jgi:two-component system CheB/CheR fusion protein
MAKDQTPDPAPADETADQAAAARFPVVGIGASAGGLAAFKQFFDALPPRTGMAFVLVPHLDPARETLLPALLSRHTPMPVVAATEGDALAADHVYVIPPDRFLTVRDRVLHLTGRSSAARR